ncbi:C45 family autoproteolytic acyltransferase/hydolase [Humisphaera borealis]|uniref:Peptidase C45 hydrolase domain-containing protein n=1 Tax=Humisphaera borealis TaxID=2807512 RepID=A0A7M2X136_9BACT|nr:C45 family peptidase [Humisphaera borealis]QOV91395.1 hypothetical protein IPV69_08590 [Humisphaera borealis]
MSLACLPLRAAARQADPDDLLEAAIFHWMDLAQPADAASAKTIAIEARLSRAAGLPSEASGATVDVRYRWPDKLRASVTAAGEEHRAGRDGQQLWVHQPAKKFGLIGKSGVPRFTADAKSIDKSVLPPFELPIGKFKMRAVLLAVESSHAGQEKIGDFDCTILKLKVMKLAAELIGVSTNAVIHVWLRNDLLPMRITVNDGNGLDLQIDTISARVSRPAPDEQWQIKPNEQDKIHTVALSHLTRFMEVGPRLMKQEIPTLPRVSGEKKIVAQSGRGRLEMHDGTRVLFLAGSPEDMGRQHGELLKPEIQDVSGKILYGIGVGSSFFKGNWFFGEVENAQSRVVKFVDPRVLREMDALADAADLHRQEARLSNFFPELFHCSGFALLGKSTADGHVYHGRVLDYLRGVGLEQNAVVTVYQPDDGRHAWVNLTYAGFVGSVTAMNEKGISIGEMGGHGYGDWDGKPMAQLVREVMENASTLDEAIAIMKAGPRTCEYYYVVADGKTKQAVGIGATPTTFEVVRPGEAHPKLSKPVEDTVLLSAGDRYDLLSARVKEKWGKFDATAAIELMSRPICMTSNIQSVLFVPDTLDFYVANADGQNVASHTRFTKYNLNELLKKKASEAEQTKAEPSKKRTTGF